jgi:hypothetical protein
VQYQKICILALSYLCVKSSIMAIIAIIAFFKCRNLLDKAEKLKEEIPIENQLQR